MSFFKPRVSFPLNFALLFCVMTHNSSEFFYLKHYMFWIKKAHRSTIFQTFEWSNEKSPKSSCNFWNQRVRVYSNFASLFSVMKDNSWNWNLIYFGRKRPIEVKFSDFWVVVWKFTKFLKSYLKQQVSFL